MTLVLIEKGLVLEGWPSKIEASWVLGIYIYLYDYIYSMYITLKTSDISSYGEKLSIYLKKKVARKTPITGVISNPNKALVYGEKSLKISLHLHCLIPSK